MIHDQPALAECAREAQRCFLRQDWPFKELVIFNATGRRLNFWPKRGVREIHLAARTRAGMLDILRENATSEWCVTWDADCWYAPTVLRQHMEARQRDQTVLFRNVTCYSLADKKAYVISDDRVAHSSFFRLAILDFRQPLHRQTPHLRVIDNAPDCVVKFVNKITHAS